MLNESNRESVPRRANESLDRSVSNTVNESRLQSVPELENESMSMSVPNRMSEKGKSEICKLQF